MSDPLSTIQALILGLLQGATELFPVSSLGHAVLLPSVLHWKYNQASPSFVPFLVLLHLGTAAALLLIYRVTWVRIIAGFTRAVMRGRIAAPDERLAFLLLAGTVPAGAVGVVFESQLKELFANPVMASIFLLGNGAVLLGAERLRRRAEARAGVAAAARDEQEMVFIDAETLTVRQAALVGLAQTLALLPGFSRSGVTMAGGLVAGLRHQEAARFSFLLATPIIAGAGLLEVQQLGAAGPALASYLLGAVAAGIAAYLSGRFLVRFLRTGRLDPFGWYCLAAGAAGLLLVR